MTPASRKPWPNSGREFEAEDVARAYGGRPPYPPGLVHRLISLTSQRRVLLDLGCGPGKLALALASAFERVVAIDPSHAMLSIARAARAPSGAAIEWIEGNAEDTAFPNADLAVAGGSIHWMEHDVVFPKLADALAEGGVVAIVDGDVPTQAAWRPAYVAFLAEWVGRLGGVYGDAAFHDRLRAHESWLDVAGREAYAAPVRQALSTFVEAEHSRATWARHKMGVQQAGQFDAELESLLAPYALNGWITYQVETRLVWGSARRRPT